MSDSFSSTPVRTIHVWLDAEGWHREETDHRPPGTDGPGDSHPRGLVRILVDEWDVF